MKQAALKLNRTREPHLGERTFPRLMLAPTLIVMLVLTAYPLLFTFFYSFTDYHYLKRHCKQCKFDGIPDRLAEISILKKVYVVLKQNNFGGFARVL